MAFPVWVLPAAVIGGLVLWSSRRAQASSSDPTWTFGPREGLPKLTFARKKSAYSFLMWVEYRKAAAVFRDHGRLGVVGVDLTTDPWTASVVEDVDGSDNSVLAEVLDLEGPIAPVHYESLRAPNSFDVIPAEGGTWQWVSRRGPAVTAGISPSRVDAIAKANAWIREKEVA